MPRPARLLAIFLGLLVTACSGDTLAGPDPTNGGEPPVRDLTWLEANAIPFITAEPGGDYSDLMPLKEIIGDARIVALGEGTHGTREFFQMKHRLLEFLVEEMGFDLFAIEATWAESNHVNQFVHTGIGNPAALLSNLHFWTWNTQEVLDMILWMREYNARGTGRTISFRGFDMQFSHVAMDEVSSYVWNIDPGNHAVVGQGYYCWRIWAGVQRYATMGDSIQTDCREGVEAAYDLLAEREAEYQQASSPEAYAHARRAARITVQHEHQASRRWVPEGPSPRDRYMAENAEWLLEQAGPDSKIVLWAHNAHVQDVHPWMGAYLRATHGDDMVIAGFSFHEGRFNAVARSGGVITGPLMAHTSGAALPGSYEYYFQQLSTPLFFTDLRPLRHSAPDGAEWLRGPLPVRAIGAVYEEARPQDYYWDSALPQDYDLWIHFQSTQPSHLLPFVTD